MVGRAPSQCSAPPDLLPSEARALLIPDATVPSTSPATSGQPSPVCRTADQTQSQPATLQQNDGVHFEVCSIFLFYFNKSY